MAFVRDPVRDGMAASPRLAALADITGPVVSLAGMATATFITQMARVAVARLDHGAPESRPAPLYVRPADAAPPRAAPPVILA
jgi:hypothetical protein